LATTKNKSRHQTKEKILRRLARRGLKKTNKKIFIRVKYSSIAQK